MPHPVAVEAAADQLAAIGRSVDDAIAAHIVDGTRLPTIGVLLGQAYPLLERAARVAYRDIDPNVSEDVWLAQVDLMLGDLAVIWQRAFRDAIGRREQVERAPTIDTADEDAPTLAQAVATGAGFGAAVHAVRRSTRKVLSRQVLRRVAASTNAPMPKITAAQIRQLVRTDLATGRNLHAARIADERGLVIRIEDARKGPTDAECERVNGLFATVLWLRRHPVEHPNCLIPGQTVTGGSEVLAAWSRPFHGQTVTVMLAGGDQVTVTPHHPVLTMTGWLPAKMLVPGTEVFTHCGGERLRVSVPHDVEAPSLIEQVGHALIEAGGVSTGCVPAAPEQFYGDGTVVGDVHVVWTDRYLSVRPRQVDQVDQVQFSGRRLHPVLAGSCPGFEVVSGSDHAAHGVVGFGGDLLPAFGADAGHVKPFGVRPAAGDTPGAESAADRCASLREVFGDHVGRFPGEVAANDVRVDRVVGVRVGWYDGPVHDLTVSSGWFGCNTLIVSNCTRRGRPVRLPAGARVTLLE